MKGTVNAYEEGLDWMSAGGVFQVSVFGRAHRAMPNIQGTFQGCKVNIEGV